jgi:hypothetical protein
MMPEAYTQTEVSDLLGMVLKNLRLAGSVEDGATPIEEVARRTGLAPTGLAKACRADVLEHVHFGDARVMTPSQIQKMLTRYSRGGDLAQSNVAQPDEMTQARKASQSSAKRASRRAA